MLATYSNETVKSIQTFIDGSQGGNILREEIEWKLQQGGMIAVAKELKGLIRKGMEIVQYYEAYEAALKEGHKVDLRCLNFIFLGPPRSGKSSMRRRLLRIIMNLNTDGIQSLSTGVELQEVYMNKADGWWSMKKGTDQPSDDEKDIITLARLYYSLICNGIYSTESHSEQEQSRDHPNSATDSSVAVPNVYQMEQSTKVVDETNSTPVSSTEPTATSTLSESEVKEVESAVRKLQSILRSTDPKDLLNILTLLIMTDVGGQTEFLDMLPSLTIGSAFYLLFFPLHEDLNEVRSAHFHDSEGDIVLNKHYKNMEVLHQALATIACFSGEDGRQRKETVHSASIASCALLVGTHKDMVTDEMLAQKEEEIEKQVFLPKLYQGRFLKRSSTGKPFITVDNFYGTEESEMLSIRSEIEQNIKAIFPKVTVPASWVMFRVALQLLNKTVISLSQCEEIARRMQLTTQDVKHALWFFHHRMGSLLYYPQIRSMEDKVLSTPDVIFKSITELIINHFKCDNPNVTDGCVGEFLEKGLFSLSDIGKSRNGEISGDQLVDILKYHGLIAEVKYDKADTESCDIEHDQLANISCEMSLNKNSSIPAERKFIIPALLKYATGGELELPHSQAAPLMVSFESGFVPFGIFCALISKLISLQSPLIPMWELHGNEVKKNRVEFKIDCSHNITFISRQDRFEIHISQTSRPGSKWSLPDICSTVQQTVVNVLDGVISNIRYGHGNNFLLPANRPFNLAFTCCDCSNGDHHLMIVKKEASYAECIKQHTHVNLKKEHSIWYNQVESKTKYSLTETPAYGEEFLKAVNKPTDITHNQHDEIQKLGIFNDDTVIVVVNKESYKAVCHFMKPLQVKNVTTLIQYTPLMTLGTFGGCNTVLVQTEVGAKYRHHVKDALRAFPNSRTIIAVGDAHGVSKTEYSFGDVLISKEVLGFNDIKRLDDGTLEFGSPLLIHFSPFQRSLIDAFVHHSNSWEHLATTEGRHACIHAGTIASSLPCSDIMTCDLINQLVPKVIGYEMESIELLKIQREYQQLSEPRDISVIIVKGISKFADEDEIWRLTAAMTAASYVEKVIHDSESVFNKRQSTLAVKKSNLPVSMKENYLQQQSIDQKLKDLFYQDTEWNQIFDKWRVTQEENNKLKQENEALKEFPQYDDLCERIQELSSKKVDSMFDLLRCRQNKLKLMLYPSDELTKTEEELQGCQSEMEGVDDDFQILLVQLEYAKAEVALENRAEFLWDIYDEITAMDVGERRVNNQVKKDEICILVWVKRKLPEKIKIQLPNDIDGVKVDVNEGEVISLMMNKSPSRPDENGGVDICNKPYENRIAAKRDAGKAQRKDDLDNLPEECVENEGVYANGHNAHAAAISQNLILKGGDKLYINGKLATLGYFVEDRDGQVLLLSSGHFLRRGAEVYCDIRHEKKVADVVCDRCVMPEEGVNVDCGLAKPIAIISPHFSLRNDIVVHGTDALSVRKGNPVFFYGGMSGPTEANLESKIFRFRWPRGLNFRINNQVKLDKKCESGDSGALVVDTQRNNAIGLIMANFVDNTIARQFAVANPIGEVLSKLKVAIKKTPNEE